MFTDWTDMDPEYSSDKASEYSPDADEEPEVDD
jgi:hypothetical protein